MPLEHLESSVEVDNLSVRYLHAGEGPPMLLLHGEGTSSKTWLHNIESLSKFFSLFAPDLSSLRNLEASHSLLDGLEYGARILSQFMSALEIDRAHLVGFSSGGVLTDLIVLRYPERVHRQVIISGLGLRYELYQRDKNHAEDRVRLEEPDRQILMKRPVLLITGEMDRMIPCEAVCYVVARNPLAKWVIVPDSHHLVHEEYPEVVNRHIISYCIEAPVNQFCG